MRRKLILALVLIALVAVAVFFFVRFSAVVGLVFFGIALTYLFYPSVQHFAAQGVPAAVSILIVYSIAAVVITFIIIVIIPDLYEESRNFLMALPTYFERYADLLDRVQQRLSGIFDANSIERINEAAISFVEERVESMGERSLDYLLSIPQLLVFLVLGPVLAYYFLRDRTKIASRCIEIFPPDKRSVVLVLMKNVDTVLRGFIRGNLLVALIVGALMSLGLFLLGMNYSLTLGLLAGLFNIIPYFGPILGSIPILFVALLQSDVNLLLVLIYVIVLQQVDSIFITPKVIGDKMGLHPVSVIVLVLIGGFLGGLSGMILVIPAAAVGKVLLLFFYENFVAYKPAEGQGKS